MGGGGQSHPGSYGRLNSFFTRALKPHARSIAPGLREIACPADGMISEAGRIDGDRLRQAKGRHYTLAELLASESTPRQFAAGAFATICLRPFTSTRVHWPLRGQFVR